MSKPSTKYLVRIELADEEREADDVYFEEEIYYADDTSELEDKINEDFPDKKDYSILEESPNENEED